MKLIIPIEFSRKGGVERITIALISSLINYVDQIVIVVPKKEYFKIYQAQLPNSNKIIYESFRGDSSSKKAKLFSLFKKILKVSKKIYFTSFYKYFSRQSKNFKRAIRINELIDQYQADYCLYPLINRLEPPKIKIPLCGISHDLFWRFASLTYAESYVKKYDDSLLMWLEKAALIIAVSEKTRTDILQVFPNPKYAEKVITIPWSGYLDATSQANPITLIKVPSAPSSTIFYFPSSFGIYKDHLTLLKAGIILAEKGLDFKIVFVGRETDGLIEGRLKLSQQSKTQEYVDYVNECQNLYTQYSSIFKRYFEGLGYCDYEKVEYLYQNSSAVVMPSKYEGFGLAVSEAIVRGLPVIASDLDVFQEQVALYKCPDRVEFFPLENAEALAGCLEELIKSPQQKLTSSEIQKRFSHWTWEEVAQAYIKALQNVQKS